MALFSQLKQVQKLRKQAKEYKNTMGDESVTGTHGAVTVGLDGTQKIQNVQLDAEELKPENKEKLEKDIEKAFEDAQKQLQKVMMKKIQAGELKMPEMQ
jgi:DNA-binding protein YbaB